MVHHASVTTFLECPDTGFLADEILAEVVYDMEWTDPTWPEQSELVPVRVRIVSAIIGRKDCSRELLAEIFGEDAIQSAEDSEGVFDQIYNEVHEDAL